MSRQETYGRKGLTTHFDDNTNLYRGKHFGQPITLRKGDVLATGQLIRRVKPASAWGTRLIVNSEVARSHQLREIRPSLYVPNFLPLQLASSDKPVTKPADLKPGDILRTGAVVLSPGRELDEEDVIEEYEEVGLYLALPDGSKFVQTPADIPIALMSEKFPPSQDNKLASLIATIMSRVSAVDRAGLDQLV